MSSSTGNLERDLKEKMHNRNAIAAVDIHRQQVAWQERYQQFSNEKKEHARKLKQEALSKFEDRLKKSSKLSTFVEEVEASKAFSEFKISFLDLASNKPIQDKEQLRLLKLLFWAIKTLQHEIVKDLIDEGVNTNVIATIPKVTETDISIQKVQLYENYLVTPLYYVLDNFNPKEATASIPDKGGDPISQIITHLIKAGSPLNTYSTKPKANLGEAGSSFLHKLAYLSSQQANFHPILKFVMQHNPDVNAVNCYGMTPLSCVLHQVNRDGYMVFPDRDLIYETTKLLLQVSNHDFITPMIACSAFPPQKIYDLAQTLNGLGSEKLTSNIFQDTCQLIYDAMAANCLQKFSALRLWSYYDMATYLTSTYGIPTGSSSGSDQYSNRLMAPINYNNKDVAEIDKAATKSFDDSIIRSAKELTHLCCSYGFEFGRFQILLSAAPLILEYCHDRGRSLVKCFSFVEVGYNYFQHVGESTISPSEAELSGSSVPLRSASTVSAASATSSGSAGAAAIAPNAVMPDAIEDRIGATEIIARSFATVVAQFKTLGTLTSPLVPTPKTKAEMDILDANMDKAFNESRTNQERLFQEVSTVAEQSDNLKNDNEKQSSEIAQSREYIRYQYRSYIRGDGKYAITSRFVTIAPSASAPKTHTVISHETETRDPNYPRRPDPSVYLTVIQYKNRFAPQNKLHLGFGYRHHTQTSAPLEYESNTFTSRKLFKHYNG